MQIKCRLTYVFFTLTQSRVSQPGKTAMDLIVDYLSCLYEYAREQITRETGAVADLSA